MLEFPLHLFGAFSYDEDPALERPLDLHARVIVDLGAVRRPRLMGTLTAPTLAEREPFAGSMEIDRGPHPWSCEIRFRRQGGALSLLRARAEYHPRNRLFSLTRAPGVLQDAEGDLLGTLELRVDLRQVLLGLALARRHAPGAKPAFGPW